MKFINKNGGNRFLKILPIHIVKKLIIIEICYIPPGIEFIFF